MRGEQLNTATSLKVSYQQIWNQNFAHFFKQRLQNDMFISSPEMPDQKPGSSRAYSQYHNLHHFPAVCWKEQMNSVILQITFLHQVWTDELTNYCGSVCIEKNTALVQKKNITTSKLV